MWRTFGGHRYTRETSSCHWPNVSTLRCNTMSVLRNQTERKDIVIRIAFCTQIKAVLYIVGVKVGPESRGWNSNPNWPSLTSFHRINSKLTKNWLSKVRGHSLQCYFISGQKSTQVKTMNNCKMRQNVVELRFNLTTNHISFTKSPPNPAQRDFIKPNCSDPNIKYTQHLPNK